jgi:hypothetical protein
MGLVPNFIARFFQDMGHRADDLELMLAADTKKLTEEALTERSPRVLAVLIERMDDAILKLKEQKGTLDGLAQNALREAVLHENAAAEADRNADLLLQQAAATADPQAKQKKNDLAAVEDQRHESESRLSESARTRAKTNSDQAIEVGSIIARLEAKRAEMEAVKKEVEAVLTETKAYETGKEALVQAGQVADLTSLADKIVSAAHEKLAVERAKFAAVSEDTGSKVRQAVGEAQVAARLEERRKRLGLA